MTDIWLRYRVCKIKVRATYFGEINNELRFAALYPYRAETSGVNNVDAVESLPHSTVKAMGTANTGPVIIDKVFDLAEIWKLYNNSTNPNYPVSADILGKTSTHWNKDPTHKVFIMCEMFAFGLLPRTLGGTMTMDVQW